MHDQVHVVLRAAEQYLPPRMLRAHRAQRPQHLIRRRPATGPRP
ncbi:hypothetical protein [Actinomycetospora soli]|nr:hypothetical protein [Actinomycetospora soli]